MSSNEPNKIMPAIPTEVQIMQSNVEEAEETKDEDSQYVHGMRVVYIIAGLSLTVFCMGLDRTILSTAIPKITSEFHSLNDVAWYGSSYLITTCCFQLMFGKLYAEFRVKWVFLAALGLFELGSLISAAAPNSVALIIGRAISGVGCAGILSGTFLIITQSFPVHKRPIYTGAIGGIAGISQLLAPTLGGVFTDRTTWCWCFWINLPIGGVTAVIMLFCIKSQTSTSKPKDNSILGFLIKLDLLGTALFLPFMVSLLLALQWGGTTYPWSNWRVILCLCLSAILLPTWLFSQYKQGDKGTLPLRIACQRSVLSGTFFMFGINGAIFVFEYYVSIWFQAVKNQTAQQSGINFLASSGSMTIATVLAGIAASKIGYYVPQMILSTSIVSVAAGLMYLFNLDTSTGYWVGTLVMIGFGTGLGMQMPLTAVQTIIKGSDIAAATSVLVLAQTLSGAVFLAVGQNLFQNRLVRELASSADLVDASFVISNGASGLKKAVAERYGFAVATKVLVAYNEALRECFLVCVVLSAVTIIGVMGMEWKSVKKSSEDEKTAVETSQKS